jgi:16S rRNA (guanine527-N7)-methyltransferase
MNSTRISALLEPFLEGTLRADQLNQISIYIDLLQRWNARINLTAIRTEEEIVTRHFGESLFLAQRLSLTSNWQPATGNRVLDIGSGAGFPALPLKIWAPEIHLTLIESNNKKSAFLKEVSRALTFTNINVITERAEDISARPDRPQAEVVTLRAVEHFEAILPQALNFLAGQSTLALLIGASQLPKLIPKTSLKWRTPIPIPNSRARVLLLGSMHQEGDK